MKTTNKITQKDVLAQTITTHLHTVGLRHDYHHQFSVNGTTYEKNTEGFVLFHSNETYQPEMLDANFATKREFAKIVANHFNSRI